MKAVVNEKYGPPDILKFKEVEKPVPGDNEVLVKIHASSINSWDRDFLTGIPRIYRLMSGPFKPKHKILGADVAGVVEAAGKNVQRLKPGDEVYGDLSNDHWGGFAEYVCGNEKYLARKPSSLSFEEAAAVPQGGVIALQGLQYGGEIREGQEILINGAGGCAGPFAIQIAKLSGAEVTAVDIKEKLELLRSLGADHVVEYPREDFTNQGKQYDLIVELIAYKSLSSYKRALKPGGILGIVGGSPGVILKNTLFSSRIGKKEGKKSGLVMHRPNAEDLDILTDLFETGKLKPVIDSVYPLEKTAEAFRHYETGLAKGKVVISI